MLSGALRHTAVLVGLDLQQQHLVGYTLNIEEVQTVLVLEIHYTAIKSPNLVFASRIAHQFYTDRS